ncbi:hypothetical protein [Luteibacter yeojuensis]|uniref:Uncharacterized protein n=1 Tax=Luteibacter yeojuensis TaxID=345309 RepID=A0A7X5TP33_9GAMM|nr:hypothetical protein [Luteibacter yeojuensis]NID14358.1 hypothetical protein [Luteibacter yeojuensis]
MTTFIALAWAIVGIGGFIYWWTRTEDLTTDVVPVAMLFGSILGPLAWGVGWFIHTESRQHKILIKRRSPKDPK